MEVRLDKISVPDKILLHKETGDIIYSDLLHAMVRVNKLQVLVDKLEVQLKHEKVENKANSIQIKKLKANIICSRSEIGNTQGIKRLLEEKDNVHQVLKKRLKIPSTEHVQSSELLPLQEEKDRIHQDMMEYKGKTIKLQEEKDKWQAEWNELIAQISLLKRDQNEEK